MICTAGNSYCTPPKPNSQQPSCCAHVRTNNGHVLCKHATIEKIVELAMKKTQDRKKMVIEGTKIDSDRRRATQSKQKRMVQAGRVAHFLPSPFQLVRRTQTLSRLLSLAMPSPVPAPDASNPNVVEVFVPTRAAARNQTE